MVRKVWKEEEEEEEKEEKESVHYFFKIFIHLFCSFLDTFFISQEKRINSKWTSDGKAENNGANECMKAIHIKCNVEGGENDDEKELEEGKLGGENRGGAMRKGW